MQPGDRVRIKDNPSRIGVLTSDPPIGEGRREKRIVSFVDGDEAVLLASIERVETETRDPMSLMARGHYSGVRHLRGAITYYRLSGKLANLIYSLNTTNTKFLPYQFKPVLQYLDSPSQGLIIADEVGLGKTIEAGLIWTELRARQDARRLLVVCPAMLTEKWCNELENRFGVQARSVKADELLSELRSVSQDPYREFALVVSMQGTRPPKDWEQSTVKSASAQLARFLKEQSDSGEEPLLDLTIVDEAHYLRNSATQAHRFAKLLRPMSDGMIFLSATPIQMRSTDLFNLLHLLDQDAFPLEWTYNQSVEANAPLVQLRDQLLREPVSSDEFLAALQAATEKRWFEGSEQIAHLMSNPPTDEQLATPQGRAEFADIVDKLNPRAKVITRTLKRDVQELRVQREPVTLRVQMSAHERAFYDNVTEAVRSYCEQADVSEGFLLTIPQRQMSSCMAAACHSWSQRAATERDEDEEFDAELIAGDSSPDEGVPFASKARPKLAARSQLMQALRKVASQRGMSDALERNDSKVEILCGALRRYWSDYPGKKVVLFAFYKGTLYHLQRRLTEQGVSCAVLHGGMDKNAVLERFAQEDGPQILLSSEVASEGVDLQFSSLLINYDLPWNPAKVEQRIGRIDRIGQEAPKILIWNLVYAETLDERVYERLLVRLNIFQRALGSMEEILGVAVSKLTFDLLSHALTEEEELRRIEQTEVALANQRREQEQLDAKATQLLGHGDFIQNKARAAHDLGRYIRGEDLYFFVRDYLESEYAGSRLLVDYPKSLEGGIELSTQARVDFDGFLRDSRLLGRTSLLADSPRQFRFENHAGQSPRGIEKITQDHPLIRFISERQKQSVKGTIYFPTSAVEVSAQKLKDVSPGTYVYVIMRWTFSGPRDVERLVYEVRNLSTGKVMEEGLAEAFVNTAVLAGDDWHVEAKNSLNHQAVAQLQDKCSAAIERRFEGSKAMQLRANRDRIREMTSAIEQDLARKREQVEDFLRRYEGSSDAKYKGLITINRNKLKKLEQKFTEKRVALSQLEGIDPRRKDVSSGVIRVV